MSTMHPAPHTRRTRAQRGSLLLEGLVAILLFSFAVLALVGLQARMKTAQSEAKYRADASYLANELLAQMWSDAPSKTGINQYNGLSCASYARCKDWQNKVAGQLPQGAGSVQVDAASQMVTVTVGWQHGSEAARTFSMRTRLAKAEDI